MKPKYDDLMTVGELKRLIKNLPENDKILFGCESLKFYRIKTKGDGLHQIQFNQTIYDNDKGEVFVENHIEN